MSRRSRYPKRDEFRQLYGIRRLELLGEVRREICGTKKPFNAPEAAALRAICDKIDDYAEVMTGNREHFWQKENTTP
jgi:hypothetical protein